MTFPLSRSILPESPRWLVAKQRYEDAEELLKKIAAKNKIPFDQAIYDQFVKEDKKVIISLTFTYINYYCVESSRFTECRKWIQSIVYFESYGNYCNQYVISMVNSLTKIIMIQFSFHRFVQNLVFYGISQNTGKYIHIIDRSN